MNENLIKNMYILKKVGIYSIFSASKFLKKLKIKGIPLGINNKKYIIKLIIKKEINKICHFCSWYLYKAGRQNKKIKNKQKGILQNKL